MTIDVERIATAAVDSFLHAADDDRGDRSGGGGGLRTAGGIAVGVGLGLAVRTAYRRVRSVGLEGAATALEQRLRR